MGLLIRILPIGFLFVSSFGYPEITELSQTNRTNLESKKETGPSDCPQFLEDYYNSTKSTGLILSLSGVVPYKTCSAGFELNKKDFSTGRQLIEHLNKYPQYTLGGQAQQIIDRCSSSSSSTTGESIQDKKNKISIFYWNMNKLQLKAQQELQQLKNLAFLIKDPSLLNKLECPQDTSPIIRNQCLKLRNCSYPEQSEQVQQAFIEDLNLYTQLVQELTSAKRKSTNSNPTTGTQKLEKSIQLLEQANPLLKDKTFLANIEADGLDSALEKKFKGPKEELKKNYQESINGLKCHTLYKKPNFCSTEKIVQTLSKGPNTLSDDIWKSFPACLVERTLDRDQTENQLEGIALNAALLFPGMALAKLALRGGSMIFAGRAISVSKLAKAGTVALGSINLKDSAPEFANSCINEEIQFIDTMEKFDPSGTDSGCGMESEKAIFESSINWKRCLIASIFLGLDMTIFIPISAKRFLEPIERRNADRKVVSGGDIFRERRVLRSRDELPASLRSVDLPDSMLISTHKVNKKEILTFERGIKSEDGSVRSQVIELPIDPHTKTVDANLSPGREFIDTFIRDNHGDITLMTADFGDLGYVSKKYVGLAEGSKSDLYSISLEKGDEYLRQGVLALQRALEKSGMKGFIARRGGDEFFIVTQNKDPEQAKRLMLLIKKEFESKEVGQIFKEEKKAQKVLFQREMDELKNRLGPSFNKNHPEYKTLVLKYKDFASHSQQSLSLGGTIIESGEDIEASIKRADDLATENKIDIKIKRNQPVNKYGNTDFIPSPENRITLQPDRIEIVEPAPGKKGLPAYEPGEKIELAQGKYLEYERNPSEFYRLGEISLVEYTPKIKTKAKSQPNLILERYLREKESSTYKIKRENIYINRVTGFIDGRNGVGTEIFDAFTHNNYAADRGVIWINTENLGIVNYFKSGSSTGDQLLKATANVIKKVIKDQGLPIKLKGSEFGIGFQKLTEPQLKELYDNLKNALYKDRNIRAIYNTQIKSLRAELRLAKKQNNWKRFEDITKNISEIEIAQNKLFSIEYTMIQEGEDLGKVMKKTRGKRYPDQYELN